MAAITESLLGLSDPSSCRCRGPAGGRRCRGIDRITRLAVLRGDDSLAVDLSICAPASPSTVRRLHVRLRFGLPISNPLQQEVRRRYPDVYRAAAEILAEVGPGRRPGNDMPVEEIGLLTMYILPARSSAIACGRRCGLRSVRPAGMATAWILVSRLVAEFPQIEADPGRFEGGVRIGARG